jgi:hypothetical protein
MKILLEYAFDYAGEIQVGLWRSYDSPEEQEIPVIGQTIPLQIDGEEHIAVVHKIWPGVAVQGDVRIRIDCQPTGVGEAGG